MAVNDTDAAPSAPEGIFESHSYSSPSASAGSGDSNFSNPNARSRLSSSSIAGEVESGPSSADLLKIIECPVCNEYPVSPIYSCAKGHFTCNDCMKILTACTVCQSQFTDVRNYALESIVDQTKFTCKYEYRGCPVTVLGANYTDHIHECSFRLIPCHVCNDVFPGTEYLDHLCISHGAQGKTVPLGGQFSEQAVQLDGETFPAIFLKDEREDKKLFVLNTQKYKSFVCWWVTCVNAKERDDHFARLNWTKSNVETDENVTPFSPSIEWDLPIHTTHKPFSDIRDSGQCAVLPSTHLVPFFDGETDTNWTINFKILKKQIPQEAADRVTEQSDLRLPPVAILGAVFFLGIAVAVVAGGLLSDFDKFNANPAVHEPEYHGYRGFYYQTDENGHNQKYHRGSRKYRDNEMPPEETNPDDFVGHRGFYYKQKNSQHEPERDSNKLWKYLRSAFYSLFGETGSRFPSRKNPKSKLWTDEDLITNLISTVFTVSFSVFCIFAVLFALTVYKGWLARDPLEPAEERRRRFRFEADPDNRGFGDRMPTFSDDNPNEIRQARYRDILSN